MSGFKRLVPRSLFGRFLLIIVIPLVLLQLVAGYVFFARHWETVSRRLAVALGLLLLLSLVVLGVFLGKRSAPVPQGPTPPAAESPPPDPVDQALQEVADARRRRASFGEVERLLERARERARGGAKREKG